MKIECPECNALYDDTMEISKEMIDMYAVDHLGIDDAKQVFKRENFLMIDLSIFRCPRCHIIFDTTNDTIIRNGIPELKEAASD